MNMNRLFLSMVSLLLALGGLAQNRLNGHIQTYHYGEDAPFATITIDDSLSLQSDFDGQFKALNLTQGKHTIKIEWPAYKTLTDTFEVSQAFEFYDFFLIPQDSIADSSYVPVKKDMSRYRASGGTVTREDIVKMPLRIPIQDISYQPSETSRLKGRRFYRRQMKAVQAKKGRRLTRKEKQELKKRILL